MNFQEELRKRLDMLDSAVVHISDKELKLVEKRSEGSAELNLTLHSPCILFEKLEDKKLKYFKNEKCADYIMYEKKEDEWYLHIFELKRSIGSSEWDKIKAQFAGALQNAEALAGFLGISINEVRVYSAYRNDKLNDFANPIKLHNKIRMNSSGKTDWNDSRIKLDYPMKQKFLHTKIKLDLESGNGVYQI